MSSIWSGEPRNSHPVGPPRNPHLREAFERWRTGAADMFDDITAAQSSNDE